VPALIGNDIDGQIEPTPDGFRVIECGRPFFARHRSRLSHQGKATWHSVGR
jgi:hypothetical protein